MPVKPLNSRAEVRDIKKRKPKRQLVKGLKAPKVKPKYGKKKKKRY